VEQESQNNNLLQTNMQKTIK